MSQFFDFDKTLNALQSGQALTGKVIPELKQWLVSRTVQ